MAQGVKKYRRPDGSTYEQYGGPKSARDVEVVEEAPPKGTMTQPPAASPTPAPTRRQTSGGTTTSQVLEKSAQEAADEAVETAKTTEKIAPWLGKKIEQQAGGLGGASKRAVEARKQQKDSDLPADKAGDAVAEDAEKKKKEKNGGH